MTQKKKWKITTNDRMGLGKDRDLDFSLRCRTKISLGRRSMDIE